MLVQRNSKLFFLTPSSLHFEVSLYAQRKAGHVLFILLTLKSSPRSPLRRPVSQKPLETFKPFHLLFQRGPCMLPNANECGGFQSRQKALLSACSQCGQGQPKQQPCLLEARPWRNQRLCEDTMGCRGGHWGVQVVKKLSKVDLVFCAL